MPIRNGYTRPADPINADQLTAQISAAIGIPVLADVLNPINVAVSGDISAANDTAIQTAINNYVYKPLNATDLPAMAVSNKAYAGNGMQIGTCAVLRKAVTNAAGIATVYLTTDGTANGDALFNTVYEEGIQLTVLGTGSYQVATAILASDKKSLVVTVKQSAISIGVIVLTAAAAGVEVRASVWGK